MNLLRSRSTRKFVLAGLTLFSGAACNSTNAPGYALGDVVVVVTDANGAPADQVRMNLMLPDKATLWRTGVTGTDGKAQFGASEGGVLVQDYLVFFPSQVQWTLGAGETNYKPVKAVENQTVTVQFKVAKTVVNPG